MHVVLCSGRPLSNVAGGPTSVAPLRPPLRSTSSASATASATAPVRPLTRVTPVVAVVVPPSQTQIDAAREREMNLLRAKILEQEVNYINCKSLGFTSGSELLCVTGRFAILFSALLVEHYYTLLTTCSQACPL